MHNLAALAAEIPAQRQLSEEEGEETEEEEVSGYWSNPEAGGVSEGASEGEGAPAATVFSDSEVQ